MTRAPDTVALNRSEQTYVGLEGVAGSLNQLYVMRFDASIPIEAMRDAVRALVRAFPRLRSVVEPTLIGYRLRLLADEDVEVLFDDAFRVTTHVADDLPALETYAQELINEPFALERGLPIRTRFLPSPEASTLILMVHHVVCDGRSMMMLMESLLRALNGKGLETARVDPPTMLPAILPEGFFAKLGSLVRSFRVARATRARTRGQRVITLGRNAPRFGPVGVKFHPLPVSMAMLARAAKAHGTTVTALVIAAIAEAFGKGLPEDGRNAVAVRLSVDLRRYYPKTRTPGFGNYVATFFVNATAFDARRAMRDVGDQLKEGLARFEAKLMSYPLVVAEIVSRTGRKLFGMIAAAAKRRGKLPPMTCHYSNLGNVDVLNAKDATIRLRELLPIAPNVGPFLVTSGLGDTLALSMSYAREEVTEREVYALLERLDEAMRSIALEETATPAASSGAEAVRIAS